jgi:hypothetical protein
MKEERFVISDQEVTELQIDLGNEDRETIHLGGNFSGSYHKLSLSCPLTGGDDGQASAPDAPIGQVLVQYKKEVFAKSLRQRRLYRWFGESVRVPETARRFGADNAIRKLTACRLSVPYLAYTSPQR